MKNLIELTSAEITVINGGAGIIAPDENGSHGGNGNPFIVY